MNRTYKATMNFASNEDDNRHDIYELAEKCGAVSIEEYCDLDCLKSLKDGPQEAYYYLEIVFDSAVKYHWFIRKAKEYVENFNR